LLSRASACCPGPGGPGLNAPPSQPSNLRAEWVIRALVVWRAWLPAAISFRLPAGCGQQRCSSSQQLLHGGARDWRRALRPDGWSALLEPPEQTMARAAPAGPALVDQPSHRERRVRWQSARAVVSVGHQGALTAMDWPDPAPQPAISRAGSLPRVSATSIPKPGAQLRCNS